MAPPRQRPVPTTATSAVAATATSAAATAIPDDSRSEASSTRERQGTTKGRKPAAAATSSAVANTTAPGTGMNAAMKEGKSPTVDQRMDESGTAESQASQQINWSTMPLSVLHEYRYAYNLSCPSAFSSQINSILLSQGAGLHSATATAIRRRQLLHQQSSDRQHDEMQVDTDMDINSRQSASAAGRVEKVLHRPSAPAQGRVSKAQLASAVRKHFNNTAISEQDAIARFLYKVNEERRGKEFRLRFQP